LSGPTGEDPLKLAILTSRSLRHFFFVNSIARHHEVMGVVREVKRDLVAEAKGDRPHVLAEHLAERDEAERRYFAEHLEPACSDVLDVGVGGSNSPLVYDFLVAHDPDAVLLFGTSIIEPPILSRFEGRIINMHLVVTPEYLRRMGQEHPDVVVYAVRLDRGLSPPEVMDTVPGTRWAEERGLTDHQYIVPGGGGFGEIMNNAYV